MDNIIGILPVNDGTIFIDSDGYIEERIGIAYVKDEKYKCIIAKFIDSSGVICDLIDNDVCFAIIGKKGDTIEFKDLDRAFLHCVDEWMTFSKAQKYFTIKTEGLPDTIKIKFLLSEYLEENHATMEIATEEFPNLGSPAFDLETYDNKSTFKSIENDIIPVLAIYAKLIGKRPKLEIYMDKTCSTSHDDKEIDKLLRKNIEQEKKYLPRLRRYINEELDKAMCVRNRMLSEYENKI